jgi:hypothetical protein
MINFQNNGKTYSIRFFYENAEDPKDENPLANVAHKRIRTTCKIAERVEDGKYEPVSQGVSANHSTDLFTKNEGRKLAMAKALQYERIENNNPVRVFPSRQQRKEMWFQYFNHHKEGRKLIEAGKVK